MLRIRSQTAHGPITLVIFGITGDLAKHKLIPALFHLYIENHLGDNFSIIGFARRPYTNQDIRDFLYSSLPDHPKTKDFLEHILYHQGTFQDKSSYQSLRQNLHTRDTSLGECTNKLYYLAAPPEHYRNILDNIDRTSLCDLCEADSPWNRILIEKPFGSDLASAEALDQHLGSLFDEDQIFRIDHYLAKETVQNLLAFRFANGIFQPLWNKKYITGIQIHAYETKDVGTRGNFYDSIGALRDVGQNHLLQLLAMLTMDACNATDTKAVRKARASILQSLHLDTTRLDECIRGQYQGYVDLKEVPDDSQTETFFRVPVRINTPEWDNVPITLSAGKALDRKEVSISVTFQALDSCMVFPGQSEPHNTLQFLIQPNEKISLSLWTKRPGLKYELDQQNLSFSYTENETQGRLTDAYEQVLYDAIQGDQLLFTTTQEVLGAWSCIDSIIDHWSDQELHQYQPGDNPNTL